MLHPSFKSFFEVGKILTECGLGSGRANIKVTFNQVDIQVGQLNLVGGIVANHQAAREINSEFVAGLEQHSGLRFRRKLADLNAPTPSRG